MPLVAFDFDGTLSDDEMIVLLGEQAGRADEIAEITERAMAGELSYAESLRERASLLSGLDTSAAERAYGAVRLRSGAADVIRALADAGVPTAILTGGFETGVRHALEREDVAVVHLVANRLPTAEGALTGDVDGPLIEGTKDEALRSVAADVGLDSEDSVAVGDGANDVPMLDAAGLAVGFRPKPTVEEHCDVVVDSMSDLAEVLASEGVL